MLSKKNQRRGSSTVEYALMLSLVTGALLLIAITLGGQAKAVFDELGGNIGRGAQPNTSSELVAVGKVDQSQSDAAEAHQSVATLMTRSIVLLGVGVIVLGSALALALMQRRRAVKAEEQPVAQKQVLAKPQPGYIAKRHEILKSLATEGRRVLHNQLAAEQIMSRRLTKVAPDAKVEDVRELMTKRQLRHVLVCDHQDCLVGVISDRDVSDGKAGLARDVMTLNPVTISPETTASLVVSILLEKRISSLPVVRENQLIGIVTTSDIAMTLQCTLQLIEQMVSGLEGLTSGSSFVIPDMPESNETAECSLSA